MELLNIPEPKVIAPQFSMVTLDNEVHILNAPYPISATLVGMVTDVNAVHL